MAEKTFKIGEYAVGGIITVRIVDTVVDINALDWNTKRIVMNDQFQIRGVYEPDFHQVDNYLNELTSCYYADKILDWIKTHI